MSNVASDVFGWVTALPSLLIGQQEPAGTKSTTGYSPGEDIPLVLDTPIGNILPGTVVKQGYFPWGGQVDIATTVNGKQTIEEYLHLDQIYTAVGQRVDVGQLVGLSGGQLAGGSHPATKSFSTGPHIKYSLFQGASSIDPAPVLKAFSQGVGWGGFPAGATKQVPASDAQTAALTSISKNVVGIINFFSSGSFLKVMIGGVFILTALAIFVFVKTEKVVKQVVPLAASIGSVVAA